MPVLSTVGAASLRAFGAFGSVGAPVSFIAATGGGISTSGNYKYHTFAGSDTFSVTAAPEGKYVDILLVGGGGSGNWNYSGGGGGGVVIKESVSISVGSYSIAIGAAGAGSSTNGGDTTGLGFTALGGGGSGVSGYAPYYRDGKAGGNGGGAGVIFGGPAADPVSTNAGAGLQPTSASGGFGNAGLRGTPTNLPGGGVSMVGAAGGGAGGGTSGKSGAPLSSSLYGQGGQYGTSPTQYGAGGTESESAIGGIVIIRYLYQ